MTDLALNLPAPPIADHAGPEVTSPYIERRVSGLCARPGCKRSPLADNDLCQPCRTKDNDRKRKWAAKRRADNRRRGLCAFCQNKSRTYRCKVCVVGFQEGRAKSPKRVSGDASVAHDGVEAGYVARQLARSKLHSGQARRGRQTTASLDDQDLADAIKALMRARGELAVLRGPETDGMPAIQRRDAVRAALSRLPLAERFVDEVLERNRGVIR